MNKSNYVDRINNVFVLIENKLNDKLTLDSMAEAAHFSKYHFSRVFTAMVGMTPLAYLTKARLDKSIHYLADAQKTILEISILCGFESASNFNAAFKKQFNKTPSEVRKNLNKDSNISLFLGNMQEDESNSSRYDESIKNNFLRRIWQMNVSIKELPEYEIAFVRHIGSYLDTYKAWQKLGEWTSKHLLYPPEQYFIGISLDNPNVTEENECRYDACVTLPYSFIKDNNSDVQIRKLPGGLYGLYNFYDTIDKLGIVYQSIFGQWLPNSEFDPDDRDCLEFCMNNPFEDPEGKAKVDLYIPIKARD
ncbi:AraC family transcriptional regulator [Cohnella herbarum]|uniref:AraC family transcriptional regulator n=1 Tax=Cohnella herbarum TaxID=2728023 RepID=A0A7Z2ZKR8_9BACL|nr:AraC family transcriptional regulator [Cohnella herbarum]QJD83258.1 AraC family transcriptional regulator [Cohnella herbarum]